MRRDDARLVGDGQLLEQLTWHWEKHVRPLALTGKALVTGATGFTGGYLVREAPAEDLKQLKILAGHVKEGQFVTKIRKTFTKGEMDDDLLVIPAKLGQAEDRSEYEEVLPTSPP